MLKTVPSLGWGFSYPKIMSALQEFVKEGADERIMPPWTLQELESALPLFPSVSLARLHELYSLWGGVVRWALARANSAGNEGFGESHCQ